MAETNSLLNCRIQQWVPGVRIPPSPRKKEDDGCIVFFFGVWRSPASAPALGAGGRRFESFCPDKLKMRELRAFATPSIFWKNQNLHSICTQTFENGHKFDFDFLVEFHVFREQKDIKKAAPFEAAHANIDNPLEKWDSFSRIDGRLKRDKDTAFSENTTI